MAADVNRRDFLAQLGVTVGAAAPSAPVLGSSNSGAAWPHLSVVTTGILETSGRGVNHLGATRWGVALRPSRRSPMLRSHGHETTWPSERRDALRQTTK